MVLRSSSLLLMALLASSSSSTNAAVTVCPQAGSLQHGLQYHSDTTCDRASYNQFKCSLNRAQKIAAFRAAGGAAAVPNQATRKCPAAGARVDLKESDEEVTGLDTVWFVENHASTPIVLAWLRPDGVEASAQNADIVPAIRDPQAILAPGAWMAIHTMEGHQFVARTVLKSGAVGDVLLQHKAGLIPVGQCAENLECPVADMEPMRNETRAEEFARTPPATMRPCHTMDVGFRNVAGCPLHAYYVRGEGDSCGESFKFHLGVQQTDLDDYMWQWQVRISLSYLLEVHLLCAVTHSFICIRPHLLFDTSPPPSLKVLLLDTPSTSDSPATPPSSLTRSHCNPPSSRTAPPTRSRCPSRVILLPKLWRNSLDTAVLPTAAAAVCTNSSTMTLRQPRTSPWTAVCVRCKTKMNVRRMKAEMLR